MMACDELLALLWKSSKVFWLIYFILEKFKNDFLTDFFLLITCFFHRTPEMTGEASNMMLTV